MQGLVNTQWFGDRNRADRAIGCADWLKRVPVRATGCGQRLPDGQAKITKPVRCKRPHRLCGHASDQARRSDDSCCGNVSFGCSGRRAALADDRAFHIDAKRRIDYTAQRVALHDRLLL
jgi:hypothetical protein